jgi:hypothetical protein
MAFCTSFGKPPAFSMPYQDQINKCHRDFVATGRSLLVAVDPPELRGAAVLELQFGHHLQEPNQGCAFIRT